MSTTMSDTVTSDNGVPHTSVGKKPGEPHVIKVQPLKRSEMQVRNPCLNSASRSLMWLPCSPHTLRTWEPVRYVADPLHSAN